MVFCLCVGVFGATITLTRLHSSIFRAEFFIPIATHQESGCECVVKKNTGNESKPVPSDRVCY